MSHPTGPNPSYTRLHVEAYTPNIGAVIHEIDLAAAHDETTQAELRRALAESLRPVRHVVASGRFARREFDLIVMGRDGSEPPIVASLFFAGWDGTTFDVAWWNEFWGEMLAIGIRTWSLPHGCSSSSQSKASGVLRRRSLASAAPTRSTSTRNRTTSAEILKRSTSAT